MQDDVKEELVRKVINTRDGTIIMGLLDVRIN